MDIFDSKKRSQIMAKIRNKDTKPERLVRSYLHVHGLRYRLHDRRLPGVPDLVFPSRRIALFVHGCFWHGHEDCKKATLPKTRTDFWRKKIESNRERDVRQIQELANLGWQVIVIWECEINDVRLSKLVTEITDVSAVSSRR